MATLHQKLAVVLVLGGLGGTLWAGYRAYRGAVTPRLIALSWLMVMLAGLQGLLGTILGATGGRPADPSHFVAGPLTLLLLPLALAGSRRAPARRAALLVAAGWLLTFALALRATGTGGLG